MNKQLTNNNNTNKLLWTPRDTSTTRIEKFRKLINEKYNLNLKDYQQLYQWSIDEYESFWSEIWYFCQIIHSSTFTKVVESKSIDEIPLWFLGSKLNYAENLLEKGNDDDIAVIFVNEKQVNNTLTYSQLKLKVKEYASSLIALGVTIGDRVVGLLPNNEIALFAYLASTSIGAIWSCTSTDFGSKSVLERFKQIDPKVLFTVDTAVFNGKTFSQVSKIEEILCELPNLKGAIICHLMNNDVTTTTSSSNVEEKTRILLEKFSTSYSLKDFLSLGTQNGSATSLGGKLTYAQVPFSHPLCILYSSGTTGSPKCMVHSHGGTLIEHMKEHLIHGELGTNDVFMYYTTTGWMMYNWLVSSLVSGCTIVLYDGAALITRMWDLIDLLKITHFGTSAKWIATNEVHGFKPIESHKLTSLKAIYSTGSPLSPQSFSWIYNWVKKDILLGSITGGSDIISCFAHHTVTLPVYEGEIQSRGLGMAVECYTEDGKAVYDSEGELVCTKAFPCMPVYFWNDENGNKYHKAYFEKFDKTWHHGDFCIINSKTGGIVMLGRSDGTLNPNGIRFGSR